MTNLLGLKYLLFLIIWRDGDRVSLTNQSLVCMNKNKNR